MNKLPTWHSCRPINWWINAELAELIKVTTWPAPGTDSTSHWSVVGKTDWHFVLGNDGPWSATNRRPNRSKQMRTRPSQTMTKYKRNDSRCPFLGKLPSIEILRQRKRTIIPLKCVTITDNFANYSKNKRSIWRTWRVTLVTDQHTLILIIILINHHSITTNSNHESLCQPSWFEYPQKIINHQIYYLVMSWNTLNFKKQCRRQVFLLIIIIRLVINRQQFDGR